MLIINIYNIRLKKKYSRDEIMKGAGISPATATKIINGHCKSFRSTTAEKVAKFLGCKAMDIIEEIPDAK